MPKLWSLLLPLAGEGLLLFLISRLLFVYVVSAVADRRGKGVLLAALRLPGNIVHEYSHALGFWLCGYRVKRVLLCLFDPQGRGSCQPGPAWSPITLPWLATGVAALLPLLTGSLLLLQVAALLGIKLPHLGVPGEALASGMLPQALSLVDRLDWHSWRSYVFLYLGLSLGAELAPSATDLRYGLPALAGLLAGVWLFFFTAARAPGLHDWAHTTQDVLVQLAQQLGQVWGLTLVVTGATLLLCLLPGLLLKLLRHH